MSPRPAKAVRGRVPAAALRDLLIDTAERLLGERQVSAITTRDIARAAGVSDGVLYNYFSDKHELIVAALVRRYDRFITRFDAGLPSPGSGGVEDNVTAYALAAFELIDQTLPLAAGLMSEPVLLHRFIAEIHRQPYGPQRLHEPIADYLAGEQRLGRLRRFDIDAAIPLLLGQAVMLGFTSALAGVPREQVAARIPGIVGTLMKGLLPEGGPAGSP